MSGVDLLHDNLAEAVRLWKCESPKQHCKLHCSTRPSVTNQQWICTVGRMTRHYVQWFDNLRPSCGTINLLGLANLPVSSGVNLLALTCDQLDRFKIHQGDHFSLKDFSWLHRTVLRSAPKKYSQNRICPKWLTHNGAMSRKPVGRVYSKLIPRLPSGHRWERKLGVPEQYQTKGAISAVNATWWRHCVQHHEHCPVSVQVDFVRLGASHIDVVFFTCNICDVLHLGTKESCFCAFFTRHAISAFVFMQNPWSTDNCSRPWSTQIPCVVTSLVLAKHVSFGAR